MGDMGGEVDVLATQLDTCNCVLSHVELLSDEESARHFTKSALVGKVITNRVVKLGVIKLVLKRVWWMAKDFDVDFLTPNTFLFSFKLEDDHNRVWVKRPWMVNGGHLVIKKWSLDKVLNELDFTHSTF